MPYLTALPLSADPRDERVPAHLRVNTVARG